VTGHSRIQNNDFGDFCEHDFTMTGKMPALPKFSCLILEVQWESGHSLNSI
jgi:hypothetical protein